MIKLVGKVVSYKRYDEGRYEAEVAVSRLTNVVDKIPVVLYEIPVEGLYIYVEGTLETIKFDEGPYKTRTKVFANNFEYVDINKVNTDMRTLNRVEEVVDLSVREKRKVGKREDSLKDIADAIAIIDEDGYSRYYRSIIWGCYARRFSGRSNIKCRIVGRLQQRTYDKNVDGDNEKREVLEVSISKIKEVKEGEQ